MSTLFRRMQHYCNLHNVPLLPQETRYELGKKLNEAFRLSPYSKIIVFKRETKEPEGVFLSVAYPKKFEPTIDKMIHDCYKEHSPPKIKERKRIPIKQPAYKHKNYPKHKKRY